MGPVVSRRMQSTTSVQSELEERETQDGRLVTHSKRQNRGGIVRSNPSLVILLAIYSSPPIRLYLHAWTKFLLINAIALLANLIANSIIRTDCVEGLM